MSPRFAGKVVVVTGAAQGIGRRVAERAAAEGARLVLVDRAEHIVELEQALAPAEATTLVADLEDYAENARAMAFAHARMGRIDVLVNNVGGTIWAKPYAAYTPDQIEAEVRRSLFPALWGCRAVLPYLIEQGGGAIVNVSSIATRSIHRVPYGAAKGESTR